MKWFVASDIHGSAYYCRKMVEAYEREDADRMLLLGDLLYHGPRNALPEEYAPVKVIEMLNALKKDIVCVRGNCEAEVDQMVLSFPVMANYCIIDLTDRMMFATHGHLYPDLQGLPLKEGDVYIQGHTHVPKYEVKEGITLLNPGSVSIPKEDSAHGYMIITKDEMIWKDLDGNVIRTENF